MCEATESVPCLAALVCFVVTLTLTPPHTSPFASSNPRLLSKYLFSFAFSPFFSAIYFLLRFFFFFAAGPRPSHIFRCPPLGRPRLHRHPHTQHFTLTSPFNHTSISLSPHPSPPHFNFRLIQGSCPNIYFLLHFFFLFCFSYLFSFFYVFFSFFFFFFFFFFSFFFSWPTAFSYFSLSTSAYAVSEST